jgi:hypothetical protein
MLRVELHSPAKLLKRQLFLKTIPSRGTFRHISGVNFPPAMGPSS